MVSAKQKAARNRFSIARKRVAARGIKPFTKAFGSAMKKEMAKLKK